MFLITVIVGPAQWALMFRTPESTEVAKQALQTATQNAAVGIMISDDFGQHLDVKSASIHGFLVEDLEKTKLAHVERSLHAGRTQALAQKACEADPAIRAALSARGPAILSPVGFPGNGMVR